MPGIAPYTRVLAAGERTTINARGTTIFVRQTSELLKVYPRSTQVADADGAEYFARMAESEKWFTAQEYDSVDIENTGAAQTTIEILLGFGDFFRPVPDIVNVQVSSPASATVTTNTDETNIDVGAAGKVTLLAANEDRINAWVTALSTNTEAIRIGDTNVDSDRGTPLEPGDTILWSSKAECVACSEATIDQGAAVTEFVI